MWAPPSLEKLSDLVEVIELEKGRAGIRRKFSGCLCLEKSGLGKEFVSQASDASESPVRLVEVQSSGLHPSVCFCRFGGEPEGLRF